MGAVELKNPIVAFFFLQCRIYICFGFSSSYLASLLDAVHPAVKNRTFPNKRCSLMGTVKFSKWFVMIIRNF